jgi:iron complex outermembrane recepter protein
MVGSKFDRTHVSFLSRFISSALVSALFATLLASLSPAHAQDSNPAHSRSAAKAPRQMYNVPGGPLAPALERFADQSGLQFIYGSSVTQGVGTVGLKGRYRTAFALEILLACSGVNYRFTGPGTVTLERRAALEPALLGSTDDLLP